MCLLHRGDGTFEWFGDLPTAKYLRQSQVLIHYSGVIIIVTLGNSMFLISKFDCVYFFFFFLTWFLVEIQLWLDTVNANPLRF